MLLFCTMCSLHSRLQYGQRESKQSEESLQEYLKSVKSQLADSVAALQASNSDTASLESKFSTVW
jgi:uncharacterized Zn finger protein (UPF0148 family)